MILENPKDYDSLTITWVNAAVSLTLKNDVSILSLIHQVYLHFESI